MQIKPPARRQRIGWRRDRFRLNELVTGGLTFRIRLVEGPVSSRRRGPPAAAFCRDPGYRSLTGLIGDETMHCERPVRKVAWVFPAWDAFIASALLRRFGFRQTACGAPYHSRVSQSGLLSCLRGAGNPRSRSQ